jgi:hypothetical protein
MFLHTKQPAAPPFPDRTSTHAGSAGSALSSSDQTNPPPRPYNAPPPVNHPLWPNTPHLTQQPLTRPPQPAAPNISKKRGPYKKKDWTAGPNSTPPPKRVVGRDGMVYLSSPSQAQNEIALQRQDETGLVTPPLSQKSLPSPSTGKTPKTPAVQTHAGADTRVAATQQQQQPLPSSAARPVVAKPAVSAMPSQVGASGSGGDATTLPPYPYPAPPAQKPEQVDGSGGKGEKGTLMPESGDAF